MNISLNIDGENFDLNQVKLSEIVEWLRSVKAWDAVDQIAEYGNLESFEDAASKQGGPVQAKLTDITDLLVSNYNTLEHLFNSTETGFPWERPYYQTGISSLDQMAGELEKGRVVLLAGMRGSNVSDWIYSVAANMSVTSGYDGHKPSIAIISSVRKEEDISMRLLSTISDVSLERMRKGELDSQAWRQIAKASGELADASLWITHISNLTGEALNELCLHQQEGDRSFDIVILDRIDMWHQLSAGVLRKLADKMNILILASTWIPSQVACTPASAIRSASPKLFKTVDIAWFIHQEKSEAKLHLVKHHSFPPISSPDIDDIHST